MKLSVKKNTVKNIVKNTVNAMASAVLNFLVTEIKGPRYNFGRIGGLAQHQIADPAVMRKILGEPDVFPKPVYLRKLLERNMGRGLLADHTESWAPARRHVAPVFTPGAVEALFSGAIFEETGMLAARWEKQGGSDDVLRDMRLMAGRVIGRALFGGFSDAEADVTMATTGRLLRPSFARIPYFFCKVFRLPFDPVGGMSRAEKQAAAAIDAVIYARMADRSPPSAQTHRDILGHLAAYRDKDTGRPFTPRQIRDHLLNFMIAGHETTASALTFAVRELARQPDIAGKIRDEVAAATGGGMLEMKHLRMLHYTRGVFLETLRINPPVFALPREATADRQYGDIKIKKGDSLILAFEAANNDPGLWEDPDAFRPERFARENALREIFLPFGGGQRACPGRSMAMVEGVAGLATLCGAFDLALKQDITGRSRVVTMQPAGTLAVTATKRGVGPS